MTSVRAPEAIDRSPVRRGPGSGQHAYASIVGSRDLVISDNLAMQHFKDTVGVVPDGPMPRGSCEAPFSGRTSPDLEVTNFGPLGVRAAWAEPTRVAGGTPGLINDGRAADGAVPRRRLPPRPQPPGSITLGHGRARAAARDSRV